MGMAWWLASLGLGPALWMGMAASVLWLCAWLALLVDPVGGPPLRVGLRRGFR